MWRSITVETSGLHFKSVLFAGTLVRIVEVKRIAFVSKQLTYTRRNVWCFTPVCRICLVTHFHIVRAYVKEPVHRTIGHDLMPGRIAEDDFTVTIDNSNATWMRIERRL